MSENIPTGSSIREILTATAGVSAGQASLIARVAEENHILGAVNLAKLVGFVQDNADILSELTLAERIELVTSYSHENSLTD